MSDPELREAVETFLADYEKAMSEYDQGYVDADATLSVLDTHVTHLKEVAEASEESSAEQSAEQSE
ncbi:hypothetical protein JCM17823_01580 [Halorubrum gandharaense]